MHTPSKLCKIVLPTWYSKVELGDYSYMNDMAEVQCFRRTHTINIGKYCSIGKCRFVLDGDHNTSYASTFPFKEFGFSEKAKENKHDKNTDVIVGNDVWICDEAVIYGGVVIGNGAVVAGNSVVTRNVEPYTIVAGNPAKVVKYRFSHNQCKEMNNVEWWDLPHEIICNELAPYMDDVSDFLERAKSLKQKHLKNFNNPQL